MSVPRDQWRFGRQKNISASEALRHLGTKKAHLCDQLVGLVVNEKDSKATSSPPSSFETLFTLDFPLLQCQKEIEVS